MDFRYPTGDAGQGQYGQQPTPESTGVELTVKGVGPELTRLGGIVVGLALVIGALTNQAVKLSRTLARGR